MVAKNNKIVRGKRYHLLLAEHEWQALSAYANREGLSAGAVIRTLLADVVPGWVPGKAVTVRKTKR
jgi:hypothetical protein